jgi:hypothetical protein
MALSPDVGRQRLAASVYIATEHRGFGVDASTQLAAETVGACKKAMTEFGQLGFLELWIGS